MVDTGNLYVGLAETAAAGLGAPETMTALLQARHTRIERIVSHGQGSPPGFWYDQDFDEWVVLLAGSAAVLIEGETAPRRLMPGDYLHLPAHVRHRVEWTDSERLTVWLAVHLG